jgi:hypothetical protein
MEARVAAPSLCFVMPRVRPSLELPAADANREFIDCAGRADRTPRRVFRLPLCIREPKGRTSARG